MAARSAASRLLPDEATPPRFLPYGRQLIEADDIAAVAEALTGDYLTTGPLVERFEKALCEITGARHAIACANGTAALYLAARALGLGPGHIAIVPAITFLATASAPFLAGAEVIFADVDPQTGLMGPRQLEEALARAPMGKPGAVFPVHYAGQSCDMAALSALARAEGLLVVEDAAHALGTQWRDAEGALRTIGGNDYADATIFSFHPVKTIAMGEGGAVTVNDSAVAEKLRRLRNHGITRQAQAFTVPDAFDETGLAHPWYYELDAPGFNWRASDLHCALGLSQLGKLSRFIETRRRLVAAYDAALAPLAPLARPLGRVAASHTAWHIYPVRIDFAAAGLTRAALMRALHAEGIGTQVHYIPVHRQPFYAEQNRGLRLSGAETYYAGTMTLPLHAGMTSEDVARVAEALAHHLAQ
jgi:UDP-4-amino-4,6-dideoxy-N-acetyl-beta-L-altrosamine transaminase